MTRNTYMNSLRAALAQVSEKEKEELLEQVEDHFDNGLAAGKSEEEICEELGPISAYAEQIGSTFALPKNRDSFFSKFRLDFGERNYEPLPFGQDFRRIEIKNAHGDIEIKQGADYAFRYRGKREKLHFNLREDTLQITIDHDILGNNILILRIPSVEELSLQSMAGDLFVEDMVLRRLDAVTAAGDIDVSHCRIEELAIETKAGDIELDEVEGDYLTGATAAGDIDISSGEFVRVILETKAGDIEYTAPQGQFVYTKTNLGYVEVDDEISHIRTDNRLQIQNGAPGAYLSTKIGDIEVESR